MAFDFEKLDVYKKSLFFAEEIYEISRNFPKKELYGLISQLRRASISVSANIAEGNGRYNKREFAQFLRIARGSIYECVPLLQISLKQSYIEEGIYEKLIANCNELAKMINGLISSLLKSIDLSGKR
jgi:four helix bundle protein